MTPPPTPAAVAADQADDVRQRFEALERQRTQALVDQDIPRILALHAADYQLITPSGQVFSRDRYVDAIRRAPFYTRWEMADFHCRAVVGMAAIRYQATLGLASGRLVRCWHTDIYENRGGAWLAVWSQATELPVA